MAKANEAPSILACTGMVAGVLLLSFAGVIVVMTPTSLVEQGAALVAERAQHFLPASPRRLQVAVVPAVPAVVYSSSLFSPTGTTTTATFTTVTYTSRNTSVFDSWDESSSGSSSESSKSSESGFLLYLPIEEEQTLFGLAVPYNTSMIVEIIFMLFFAIAYQQCAVIPILQDYGTLPDLRHDEGDESDSLTFGNSVKAIHRHEGRTDFKNTKFGCLADIWVTVHGCLCPLPRMGHTNEVAGVCGYWQTICCFSCCAILTCGCGPFCLVALWRKRVKEAMGIKAFGCSDVLYSTFCMLCNVCQQATAVDRKMGYVVSGCCDVTPTGF